MVVFALLKGLTEALAQGLVTLRGHTGQELLYLKGAVPHLYRGPGEDCKKKHCQLDTQNLVPTLNVSWLSPHLQPWCPRDGPRQVEWPMTSLSQSGLSRSIPDNPLFS